MSRDHGLSTRRIHAFCAKTLDAVPVAQHGDLPMKKLALVLTSALAGAVVVVACSDDSPHDVDAATCDCPAAEPPVTVARIHRVEGPMATITASTIGGAGAACTAGEVLVTGGCIVLTATPGLVLTEAFPNDAMNFACGWFNNGPGDAQVRAIANCLRPAP